MRFFRYIFLYLMRNERLINRLAESKPIRRAAQFVVSLLARTGTLHNPGHTISNPKEFAKQLKKIAELFNENLKEIKHDIKKDPPKKSSKE